MIQIGDVSEAQGLRSDENNIGENERKMRIEVFVHAKPVPARKMKNT
jgi:hypothetical protein